MAYIEHYFTRFEAGCFYHVYNRSVDRKQMFRNEGNYLFFLQKYHQYLSPVLDTYSYCLLGNHFHLFVRVRELQQSVVSPVPVAPIGVALATVPLGHVGHIGHVGHTDLTTFGKLSNLANSPIVLAKHPKSVHDIVSHQFRKFFQSYAMAFNKQHDRIGTLFQTPFKRALVDNEQYFTNLIYYIHANPQVHGTVSDFREWKWSSYHSILKEVEFAENQNF